MRTYKLSITAIALAFTFNSINAYAASGVGAITHDIQFSGIIAEKIPQWTWALPEQLIRIDLKDSDGVTDTTENTKTWELLQNRQPYRFLEGYMEPTVKGLALQGLNADVIYLQDGVEVAPVYEQGSNATILLLNAVGNIGDDKIDGKLKLTLQPVLLLAQAETVEDKALKAKPLSGIGVVAPEVNAVQAYTNAKVKLESQQAAVNATNIIYDQTSTWPVDTLADGRELTSSMIGGYASTISAGKLSFPITSSVGQWRSAITVQVQYK